MFSDDLFEKFLIDPVSQGADCLHVVSGYATAAMAFRHIHSIQDMNGKISVDLVVGMCPYNGLSMSNHEGFKKLVEDDFAGTFNCSYLMNPPAVHSKIYAWTKNNRPFLGFSGSANYTQNAFCSQQRETMAACDANKALTYFEELQADTVYCTNHDADNCVRLYKENVSARNRRVIEQNELKTTIPDHIMGLPKVTISLLTDGGALPKRSGLNWGQRPDQKREPNQAYIRLPASVYREKIFPERSIRFTVFTDDGKTIICSRAQADGKAVHTPHNNSLIGEYFRNRLGLASGSLVMAGDLAQYGRSDVTFYKIDDETYFLDFSV